MMPPVRRTAARRIIVDPLVRYLRALYHDVAWLVFWGFTAHFQGLRRNSTSNGRGPNWLDGDYQDAHFAIGAIAFAIFKIVVGTVLWLFRAVFGWRSGGKGDM
jgi:hypothetical protein